jgi:hypothetical protein
MSVLSFDEVLAAVRQHRLRAALTALLGPEPGEPGRPEPSSTTPATLDQIARNPEIEGP